MILYHVCFAEFSEGDIFSPRVPDIRGAHEDNIIPRICLSSSISGCISAVPWGGLDFESTFIETSKGYRSYPIKVYEFDTEDIHEGNLITPKELYEKDWVRDALINDEYWIINQNLKPRKTYFIGVADYEEIPHDCISYENLSKVNELEEQNIDYDYDDFTEGSYTSISIDDYTVLSNDAVTINDIFEIPLSLIGKYDDEEELKETIKSLTQDYLVLDNDVAYVDISNDTIEICTYSICSIELNDLVIRINENL